jgi:hypothetical protein
VTEIPPEENLAYQKPDPQKVFKKKSIQEKIVLL